MDPRDANLVSFRAVRMALDFEPRRRVAEAAVANAPAIFCLGGREDGGGSGGLRACWRGWEVE